MKSKELPEKRQNRKNRGITLIVLVVTIVVLLILAAVSISMLGGENGIIEQSQNAKKETEIADEKEKIEISSIAAAGRDIWGAITEENFRKELDTNIGNEKYTLTKDGDIFIVTYIESNRSYEVDANGNIEELKPPEEGIPGNRYDEDTDITIGDDKVTIPGGSTISKIPGEYEDIDDGLVIYIIPKDETPDWTAKDENGIYEVQKKYDQFVWVPVKNAVLDLSGNTEALASDDSVKAEVQKEIDAGRYPMAIKKDATNYFGVLYGFTETGGVTVKPLSSWEPISEDSEHREPAYLADNEADGGTYNNVGITENLLQSEFNMMATRVAKNNGFWIGRYETSNMVSDNSQDTTNKVTVIRGTTVGISGNDIDWYRMYAQQKTYKNLALTESTRVISSMIWGSQWDQIMIWMKRIPSEYIDTKYTGRFYVTNSVGMGNFGIIGGVDDGWSNSSPAPTGNSEKYKVKNVFDLAGNVNERTLEARSNYIRIYRGGDCKTVITQNTRADYRFNINIPVSRELDRRFTNDTLLVDVKKIY